MVEQFKKSTRHILLTLIVCSATCQLATAQPFIEEIKAFKEADSLQPPPRHAILFVGSSSFRKWLDVQDYFPGYLIINRGFGGSTLPDLIRYAGDIIFPYDPKQVVIYCGENDFASADSVSGEMVFERFKKLFTLIRSQLPAVPIAYISNKPSPSRARFFPKMIWANDHIKSFLQKQKKAVFIDVYHLMLDKDGQVLGDIFLDDKLHMNAKGYAIWKKAIQPYLLK